MHHETDHDIETPAIALGLVYAAALLGALVAMVGLL